MTFAKLIIKNLTAVKSDLEKEDKARMVAARRAVSVEGYRLKGLMAKEIRQGGRGPLAFSPLSTIARTYGTPGMRNKQKALSGLAKVTRYNKIEMGPSGYKVEVGFVGPIGNKAAREAGWVAGHQLSKSHRRIAEERQEDRTEVVTDSLRKYFRAKGISRYPNQKGTLWKHFFLKKSTTTLKTPGRPIIAPFWERHRAEAERNIVVNFGRKMRGERI